MATNGFYPKAESEQVVWLTNFLSKLPLHASACGISDAEVAGARGDIDYGIWLLQDWHPATRNDAKSATAYKALMMDGGENASRPRAAVVVDPPAERPPGIEKRLFKLVARIKASGGYNEAIGHDLGLIATPASAEHPVPEFSVAVELGESGPRVRIDFKKYGHDGIWIESRVDASGWAFLAVNTEKPCFDERPVPAGSSFETREYRLRWWDKSVPHGEWSAVQRAVVGN